MGAGGPGLGRGHGQGRDEVASSSKRGRAHRAARHAVTGTSGSATPNARRGAGDGASASPCSSSPQTSVQRRVTEGGRGLHALAPAHAIWRSSSTARLRHRSRRAERPRNRVRGAGQRRPGGVACRAR